MKMSIGIAGASGLIGSNLFAFLQKKGQQVLGTYCSTCQQELVKFDLLEDDFSVFGNCKVVVICSAISNLDKCLLEKELAYQVNVVKTIELINYLARNGIKTIFLSSDQVFDGRNGDYAEGDEPNPVNCYGSFKLCVEEYLINNIEDHLVLRLRKTYSTNIADGGMLADIINAFGRGGPVRSAYNLIFNPTDVSLVCNAILQSIEIDLKGLYHLADKTIMSRYEFACAIAKEYGYDPALVESIDFNSLPCIEKRALNSSLNVTKINKALCLTG
jgi:dTDP-4-dehydrorhamnose reductase